MVWLMNSDKKRAPDVNAFLLHWAQNTTQLKLRAYVGFVAVALRNLYIHQILRAYIM